MTQRVKVSLSTPRKHTGGAEVQLHSFLTSVLHASEWLTSRSDRITSRGKTPGHFGEEKISGPTGIRTPNRKAGGIVVIPNTLLRV
jgi:hypothetical protein